MKGEIKIRKENTTWVPKTIIDAGFQGTVPFLANASTVVLLHPKASLDQVRDSLKIILQDIELRKEMKSDEMKGENKK